MTTLLESLPDTPMMQQYKDIKLQHPAHLLLFRMGDFYELFADDALVASDVLSIALTMRQDKVPMCGIPHHALYNYLPRILAKGLTAAICEQLEDPAKATGKIVSRGVTRILTPGTLFEEELLGENQQAKISALTIQGDGKWLMIIADLSTEQISIQEPSEVDLCAILITHHVQEVLCNSISATAALQVLPANIRLQIINSEPALSKQTVLDDVIKDKDLLAKLQTPLGILLNYVERVSGLKKFNWTVSETSAAATKFLHLDDTCIRTLDLLQDQEGNKNNSLVQAVNHCKTPAGVRLLEKSICKPFTDLELIKSRQQRIEFFLNKQELLTTVREQLTKCSDLERLITSLRRKPMLHHLDKLRQTCNSLLPIASAAIHGRYPTLLSKNEQDCLQRVSTLLNDSLLEELPGALDDRQFLKTGYSNELDEKLELKTGAQGVLLKMEEELKANLGITTLKIKHNKIYGYFIEVSKGAAEKMPETYQRRQTLVNGERYTSPELQDLEEKLLNAKEQVLELHQLFFQELVAGIERESENLQTIAQWLAEYDMCQGLAFGSMQKNYRFPRFVQNQSLHIEGGRHPIIEACSPETEFIENDLSMDAGKRSIGVITGPNMGGKSTFIRQTGLIQILAQMGCPVPVKSAELPIVDRIFTRIGAFDRLSKGESTFFVEMKECANIFRHYSAKSLILLDEVGRGTSSKDGLSIAQAMLEYFSAANQRPKVLFATHFSELASLSSPKSGIFPLSVQVKEHDGKVYFLHKILDGVCDQSYGVHVAEMAGLPSPIVQRASSLLRDMDKPEAVRNKEPRKSHSQLDIFVQD